MYSFKLKLLYNLNDKILLYFITTLPKCTHSPGIGCVKCLIFKRFLH